jgi:hypothetical protein
MVECIAHERGNGTAVLTTDRHVNEPEAARQKRYSSLGGGNSSIHPKIIDRFANHVSLHSNHRSTGI